jgi:hypothetical protein
VLSARSRIATPRSEVGSEPEPISEKLLASRPAEAPGPVIRRVRVRAPRAHKSIHLRCKGIPHTSGPTSKIPPARSHQQDPTRATRERPAEPPRSRHRLRSTSADGQLIKAAMLAPLRTSMATAATRVIHLSGSTLSSPGRRSRASPVPLGSRPRSADSGSPRRTASQSCRCPNVSSSRRTGPRRRVSGLTSVSTPRRGTTPVRP